MRTFALLLLLLPGALAQPKLIPKDEDDIRALIREEAKKVNERRANPVWSERGPFVYVVHSVELVAADVALADADGGTSGAFPETHGHIFIAVRRDGKWKIARHVQLCPRAAPPMPLAAAPQPGERGSSDCPN
jgi:hypothetical protein